MSAASEHHLHFVLPAVITIETVENIFENIKKAELERAESFSFDASGVELITTPGVQLIMSASQTLQHRHIGFSVQGATENFKDTFKILGLQNVLAEWSAAS